MINAMHYLNGNWVNDQGLVIPVRDLSVVRGFGVFDYLRTYQNKPFHLDAHIDRFYNSAQMLELEIPISKDELKNIVSEGLTKNSYPEKGIRMILTGGVSDDLISPSKPSLIVCFYQFAEPSEAQYKNGVKVITTPHVRHIPEAKSLSYLVAVLAQKQAKQIGAVEALYVDPSTTQIFEATTSNIFAVKDGLVITPKDDILKGTTRQIVLDLCKDLGIKFSESDLFLKDLPEYSEMFLTAANKEVLPVISVDEQVIGDGKVGEIAKQLEQAYKKQVEKELEINLKSVTKFETSLV